MPFGMNENLDPTAQAGGAPPSIFQMLATQFLPPEAFPQAQAPGLSRTAFPDFSTPQQDGNDGIITMNDVAPKTNALSSIGGMAQQLAPMLGAAMSANAGQKADATSAMKNSTGTFKLPGDPSVGVALGSPGGYALNLPALPTRRQ
jgi:hypothetical protein